MAKKKKDGGKRAPAKKKIGRAPKSKGAAPKKGKSKAKPAPRPAPAPRGASCHFVCSECYEEFSVPTETLKQSDSVTCPDCLHVGKRPDDEFLGTVLIHKGQESRLRMLALVVAAAFVVAGGVLVYSVSPYASGEPLLPKEALLGICGLLFLALMGALWKYESNRWEVYF